ncbi:colanic acid biosynthesis glycosyltransferase WcaL [Rubrobacter xylanophilus]|uniref:Colanic acid biosynthesis glycosyltransferase WcaL n=1 Tax=Rubrobacter xylanophilus TaxID=49319 RepID=A0A510HHC5_9ACTN|nr:glycosyltransferase [Rubrobacter xylanophilus]BBL79334.1 colanic acid biosynthesis glycosyltransferase WcaL [Rubrobacter xylanophilus]
MRLIYVTSTLPYGKKEAFVIPEVRELLRRGHEVLVVPAHPRGAILHGDAKPLLPGTVSERLLSGRVIGAAARVALAHPRRVASALGLLLRSRGPGVLLRNLAAFPKALWLSDLVRHRGAEHVHAHWATVPATVALVAGTVTGVPWSFTAHRFDITEDNLLGEKVRGAGFVRAISRRGAREIQKITGFGAAEVIHMGVELPPRPARRPGPSDRALVAANLLEVKGHVHLFRALGVLRDRGVGVRLDVAGDGPLLGELAREVRRLRLEDRVAFLGLVPHGRLLERMRGGAWGMFVLPSIVTPGGEQEGIPVSLVEAMGCGMPVVATATGGIPELLEGVDGALLVPPEDPEALADAMERLLREPGRAERLAAAGRRRVEEEFSVRSTVDILERLFGEHGRRASR